LSRVAINKVYYGSCSLITSKQKYHQTSIKNTVWVGYKTPVKQLKNEDANELVIERVLHAKRYSLTLNKKKCTGCGICMEICPREAVEVTKTPKGEREEVKTPTVALKEEKCTYCGICEALCPFGALSVKVNGEHFIPVVNSESFPQLVREITVDETKCGLECMEIEEPCPLDLIEVKLRTQKGKDSSSKVTVKIDKNSCPCCRVCETKFPDGAVRVEKIFHGNLRIHSEKCPEGCHDCLDVCPIPGVLYLSGDGKVHVNELNCVYCGVCNIVCPEEGALELNRTRIRHTEVRSGAWNKALEKLASTKALTKELKTKSGKRLKESIKKRFPPEVEDYV
jgi:4Fe-4S ferredoxin